MASIEARLVDPSAIALMLDEQGNLTEAVGGNVWLVQDGVLMTPTDRNILRGQTRNNAMNLAKKLNIPVVEKDLQPWHLYNCDEAFLSSTYPGPMQPISRFNGIPIGMELPDGIIRRLADAWSDWVGMDITGLNRLNAEEMTMLEKEKDKLNQERTHLTHIPY
jgi:branched-chain amino acid aminotransferase